MKWWEHARWAYFGAAWIALAFAVAYRLNEGAQMTIWTALSLFWIGLYLAQWTLKGVWPHLPHWYRYTLWAWRWRFIGKPLNMLAISIAELLTTPDWYWDADDPEQAHPNWEEIPEIENLHYGETTTITVERLLRMATHRYRVTRPTEEAEEAGAEMIVQRIAIPRKPKQRHGVSE